MGAMAKRRDSSGAGGGVRGARPTSRRCIVTGAVQPKEGLLRFVVGPDGRVVPDVDEKLPGRGFWLSADRDVVNTACAKNLFAKAARGPVAVSADVADVVERLLVRRCVELIGLARRAHEAVAGFEKVRDWLRAGRAQVLVAASDGAADGRIKVRALAPHVPVMDLLSRVELGTAMGREDAVHMAIAPGPLADGLRREGARLAGFRKGATEVSEEWGAQR